MLSESEVVEGLGFLLQRLVVIVLIDFLERLIEEVSDLEEILLDLF